jgi:hypothetical protein
MDDERSDAVVIELSGTKEYPMGTVREFHPNDGFEHF